MKNFGFCAACGTAHLMEKFPKTCLHCQTVAYKNPTPVAVVLIPIEQGILLIQRGISPKKGEWALPGGFMELHETWQEAGAREVFEETHISLDPQHLRVLKTPDFDPLFSTPGGQLLVFLQAPSVSKDALKHFVPHAEVQALKIANSPEDLAFPSHSQALMAYLGAKG